MKELSLSQLSSDQIQQAIAQYENKIVQSPQSLEAYASLGHLYVTQEQWQQARDCYQKVLLLEPDFAPAHQNLVMILARLGNEGGAVNHLFKFSRLKPDVFSAQKLYELGQVLVSQNKPGRAIACYHAAIDSQTDFFAAYAALGKLLIAQEKNQQALKVYRLGVRNNPQNHQFYLALAQALASQKKWHLADKNYQKAANIEATAEIYYHWGVTLAALRNYTQAESCWQKTIFLQENYAPAYYQLGVIWQNRQQWQKAIAAYRRVLSINPKSAITFVQLGRIYHELEEYDQAITYYSQALNHSDKTADAGNQALAGYRQALAKQPQQKAIAYYDLAKLLRGKGRFAQAIANFQESLKLDPYFKDAYIALQYTPIAKQKLDVLVKFYRQIVAKHPDINLAWGNLGDVLTQQNCIDEAIKCYQTCAYQQATKTYPDLAKLNWPARKLKGPDFIIAGTSKGGTSSLYFYLSRHPQILLSHKKEIDFYWKNFKRGIDWYLAHFPSITDQDGFLTGEATPNYLRFSQVAQRIKTTFPQTKIIILLRNPADRAISWHYHKLNTGLTNQDLGSAIAQEQAKLATMSEAEITKTGFNNPDNILGSLYIYKIRAWIELLGREQFLILQSEKFYQNPSDTMSRVCQFLGLPDCPLQNYPQVNSGSYSEVDSELRKTLVDYFVPYNQQLKNYLDTQFDWE